MSTEPPIDDGTVILDEHAPTYPAKMSKSFLRTLKKLGTDPAILARARCQCARCRPLPAR